MNAKKLLCSLVLLFLCACFAHAADNVLITEFLAANDGTLRDEDDDAEDWIELHNAGTNTVNLLGWFLTDNVAQLTKWSFPSTNLPPNAYLIVWASSKNRRVPGAPLHTNFRLNNGGEYLALVRPDGVTVASAFAPAFPVQVEGVAYGITTIQTNVTLLPTGALARVLVPTDGSLDPIWITPGFIDTSWAPLPTGVGFETDGLVPFVPVTNANSVTEFSGVQGQNNWWYGYWDKDADANGQYSDADFVAFPSGGGGWNPGNYWTGSIWDWFAGDPPFTQLTSQGGRPSAENGITSRPVHWAVRRYVNEFDGPITISGTITHTSDWVYVTQTGVAGTGLLYLYLDGGGEGYIDDVKVVLGSVPESGANLITNGDFETGAITPWTTTANTAGSAVTTAFKHAGARSLRLATVQAGSTQGDSVWQPFTVTVGATYSLSYWFLPVPNNPAGTVRASGSWFNTSSRSAGDGTVARIFVDGVQVHQQTAYVSSNTYSVTVPAHLGSKIDLALDAGAANHDLGDLTVFTATIATGNPLITSVADAAADWSFSGVQGEKNWFQGYYNKNTDPDLIYQATNFIAFPRNNGPHGSNNFWDGQEWDWPSGDPPFDKIGQYWMIPNGTNSGAHHWTIRRWVSEVAGDVTVTWSALKEYPDQNNSGGGGVNVRVLHKGVQRDSAFIAGGDTVGVQRSLTLTNVQVGDAIDLALDPTDGNGVSDDDTDRTLVTISMRGSPSLTSLITSGIAGSMLGVNASAYLRLPFNVTDASVLNVLTLRMKFDDGFVAYLNGVEVARFNTPLTVAWDSSAASARPDSDNNEWTEWNLTSSLGLLHNGTNVLAIQGLNVDMDDGDFLILPELIAATATFDLGSPRYFVLPTPGAPNGTGNTNLGPVITDVSHSPSVPLDHQNLYVTARVAPTFYPVASLSLIYRVMFSNEVTIAMFDDGAHGDGLAADGVFGAFIPAAAAGPGELLRYYIFATDSQANPSRSPSFLEPKNSPQYEGTVVINPGLTNPLPVMQLFVLDQVAATNYAGTRGTIFWDGELFDNIEVSAHGQTTWFVFPKRSMNFNLNSGYKLRPHPGWSRVKAFDLLTTAADKAYLRMSLGFETFRNAGVPTHDAFPVRLQQNNAFHSVMHFVEQANEDFLERNGLSPTGALYKIYLQLTDAYTGAKKLTRKNEPNDDLQALLNGLDLNQPAAEFRAYMFDNMDIPEVINFMATIQHVQNEDCCGKNFFMYRDTAGNGEWQLLPWDLDLTFGRVFTAWQQVGTNLTGGYYNTNLYAQNLYYSQARNASDYIGVGTHLPNAILSWSDTLAMFYRRWTTIMEEMLQKTGTHPLALKLENRLDEYAAQIAPDAALDLLKWRPMNPPAFLLDQTLPQAVSLMKTSYFAPRRPWIFNTLAFANNGPYVGTQPSNAVINFGVIEFNPASGNQSQEYFTLLNPNSYAVDMSGWKLSGALEHTFKGGVVLPPGGVLYVSPDVKAFRARTTGPSGGQGLFVQGNYKGSLSTRGESLQLVDNTGRSVAATNYTGTPSLAQQYLRITEIMYHPAPPPPGLSTNADEFEFIELKNVGPAPLSLIGVRLTNGVFFNFTGSGVTNLLSGANVVVARNLAAFTSRYGGGVPVAGQWIGQLDNNGETIRLEDAAGEKVLEFAYNNTWYPITDGEGFSLVIVNENAAWDTWGLKESWRPSSRERGSPGTNNPAFDLIAPIRINELTSHTVPPALDTVELYNPAGTNVDIGGWFLTDDFLSPRKYRIPNATIITAGGRLLLNEDQFNPTNPPSPTGFAFSSTGDEVFLFSATTAGDLTGYYHGFDFGAAAAGVSFGRHVTSVGAEHFVAQTSLTLPGVNAGPKVDSIVITEIHYHPPDLAGGEDNSDDEFIELKNLQPTSTPLFHAGFATNTWQVRGGVDFDFPTNVTLAGSGYLLLVNFNPTNTAQAAAFRARFNVPVGVPLFGPYSGKLDNSSGSVRLQRPDAPLAGDVPYILVDAVDYLDAAPWPIGADGNGASLQRLIATQYGNDPINWIAGTPGPGRAPVAGTPPAITTQPLTQLVLATAPAIFTVAANGTAPLQYQWQFNGASIPGATGSTHTISFVRVTNAGVYSVTVFNGAGAAQSSNALLSVGYGPYFTTSPTNVGVRSGLNGTLVASAFGTGPMTFQWLFNGGTPPGNVSSTASNSTLTITNMQPSSAGTYVVLATDSIGTVPSTPAVVTYLVDPIIIVQPLSQSTAPGANLTLSVVVSNSASLPIGYRWRKNGSAITNGMQVLNQFTSFFIVTNAQSPAGTYSVVVTNAARPSGVTSAGAIITVLTDTDGDGLPDAWENEFGLAAGNNADRDLDADGDRMSNWAEYIAGTNPTNALSYLRVDAQSVGLGATVSFGAISNRTYTVLFADGLEGAPWLKLGDFVARTNNRVEVLNDPAFTTGRYYRVATPRQP